MRGLSPSCGFVRSTCAFFLLLFAFSAPASAFKGREHRELSNAALRLALESFSSCAWSERDLGQMKDCIALPLSDQDLTNLQQLLGAKDGPSYGDYVAFVDFVNDPAKLLAAGGGLASFPRNLADLNEDLLGRLKKKALTLHLTASQNNESHFQQQMMESWWRWHQQAVHAASRGRNQERDIARIAEVPPGLFSGLVYNAIADHFLEDFFAPGHVVPPRDGMQDAAALSMHNYYNRKGRRFLIDPEAWPRLGGLLTKTPPATSCGRGAGVAVSPKAPPLETVPELSTGRLILRGDGYLILPERRKKDPVLAAESASQWLFMKLVIARSIVDVLESYCEGSEINSLSRYEWQGMKTDPSTRDLHLAHGGMAFGRYADEPVDYIHNGLISLLEFAAQSSPRTETESARGSVGIVVIPTFRLRPPGKKLSSGAWVPSFNYPTLSLGLSYRLDEELDGFGGTVRAAFLLPRLDTNVSFTLGAELYEWDDRTALKFHPEVRLSVGISMVNLFLGVGHDYTLGSDRELEGGIALRGGIQVSLPWSLLGKPR